MSTDDNVALALLPPKLREIVELCDSLPEGDRRELLLTYAENSAQWEPAINESFDIEDIRQDPDCTDEVGIFLQANDDGSLCFKVTLGPEVQTLTRALATILCRGLSGCTAEQVLQVPSSIVRGIVGGELVRQRSRTVYYLLNRMKETTLAFRNASGR